MRARQAFSMVDPTVVVKKLPPATWRALEWVAGTSAREIMLAREAQVCKIKSLGEKLRREGACREWLQECEPSVRGVLKDVNGPLLEELLRDLDYEDVRCVKLLRGGARLMGLVEECGLGERIAHSTTVDPDELRDGCAQSNCALLQQLQGGEFEHELMAQTQADAELGRMTRPVPVEQCDLEVVRLHPRFAVEQGVRPDGTTKIRPVDNFSWHAEHRRSKKRRKEASVNGHCQLSEKITHDHVDDVVAGMAAFKGRTGMVPWLWKLDVDSAFRRIPLAGDDQWAAWVAFLCDGQVYVSGHRACPFGATASVQAWERIGAMLKFLAVTLFGLVSFRYVDDYMGIDRPQCAEHGMRCMAELVRAVLGYSAVADRKLGFGASLVCLGVQIMPKANGYTCELAKEKAEKCVQVIEKALADKELYPGTARKLAGRLSWATQFLFRRLGRAMLRPLFTRAHSSLCALSSDLSCALEWWLVVLKAGVTETKLWRMPTDRPAHLYVDARGVPPRWVGVHLPRHFLHMCA
jgi:hypothetical protein